MEKEQRIHTGEESKEAVAGTTTSLKGDIENLSKKQSPKIGIKSYSIDEKGGIYFGEMTVTFVFSNTKRCIKDYDEFYKKINQCCFE